MLMKEIKDDANRWKIILCSYIGKINTVKMTVLHKVYLLTQSVIRMKLPMAFFIELEPQNFQWRHIRS